MVSQQSLLCNTTSRSTWQNLGSLRQRPKPSKCHAAPEASKHILKNVCLLYNTACKKNLHKYTTVTKLTLQSGEQNKTSHENRRPNSTKSHETHTKSIRTLSKLIWSSYKTNTKLAPNL